MASHTAGLPGIGLRDEVHVTGTVGTKNMSTPIQKTPEPPRPSPAGITLLPVPAPADAAGLPELPRLPEQPFSAFGSISQFRDAQRMAALVAHSSMVPENYRGDEHLGNCVIALEVANRLGVSILAVMQNLQLVQGRSGWSSQFLIACLNSSKRFSPLRYEMIGKIGEDDWHDEYRRHSSRVSRSSGTHEGRIPAVAEGQGAECPLLGYHEATSAIWCCRARKKGYRPPVRSIVIRRPKAKMGVRLVHVASLRQFLLQYVEPAYQGVPAVSSTTAVS